MPEILRGNRVVVEGREGTWGEELQAFAESRLATVLASAGAPVAIVVERASEAVRAVAGMVGEGIDVLLLERGRLSEGVRELLDQQGFLKYPDSVQAGSPFQGRRGRVQGRVTLLTSGSSGVPKLVAHTWATLFTGRHLRNTIPRRWLVPYQVGTYAWFQLVTLGLFVPNQTLVFADARDPEDLIRDAVRHGVDSISATPTFWRLACLRIAEAVLKAVPLSVITLGGEVADQMILDRLKSIYPLAQITHIYASTEAGTCLVVKDGRAGFPVRFLYRNEPGLPALRIDEDRLWIRSPFSTRAAGGEEDVWIDSGDLVQIRGDRAYFVGRSDRALINVGGNKAYPTDIEAVLLAHPGVHWCRVRGVRSPFVGSLPEADIVVNPVGPPPTMAELTAHCSGRLPGYAIPRLWNFLPAIPVQSSLKSAL